MEAGLHPATGGDGLAARATAEQIAKLIQLTERYCVVYQTLRGGVPIAVSHRVL